MRPELEWQADPVQLLRGLANRVADTAACEGRARAEFNDLTRFYTAELWADYNIPAEVMDAALNAARSALDASQAARGHAIDCLDLALTQHTSVARLLVAAELDTPKSILRDQLVAAALQRLDSNVDVELTAVTQLLTAHGRFWQQRRAS